jgi:protein MpaA
LAALALLGGCAAPRSDARLEPSPAPHHAGESVQRRSIEVIERGDGPLVVLLLAAIHGDEDAGTRTLRQLDEFLARDPSLLEGRTVILVPVANPDGVVAGTRGNARGVDLNRNFPAANFHASPQTGSAPLSEPEARLLARLVEDHRPARVVALHQAANLLDWDGPGETLASAVAAAGPLPLRRMGARPGSLGSWVGVDLGIPVLTVEQPATAGKLSDEEHWAAYGPMLVEAIRFEG